MVSWIRLASCGGKVKWNCLWAMLESEGQRVRSMFWNSLDTLSLCVDGRGEWRRGLVPGREEQTRTQHLASGFPSLPSRVTEQLVTGLQKQSSFYLSNVLRCIFDIVKFNHFHLCLLSSYYVAGASPGSGSAIKAHSPDFMVVRIA